MGHGAPPLFMLSLPPSFPDLGSLSTHYVLFLVRSLPDFSGPSPLGAASAVVGRQLAEGRATGVMGVNFLSVHPRLACPSSFQIVGIIPTSHRRHLRFKEAGKLKRNH